MSDDLGETCGGEAERLFRQGYTCAQSVLAACAPQCSDIDAETALRLASGLGAGVAGLRETCGAVLSMAAILGLRHGPSEPMDDTRKAALYSEVQAAIADFDAAFGCHGCQALLAQAGIEKQPGDRPEPRTQEYYDKRPCTAFVRFCAARAMRQTP